MHNDIEKILLSEQEIEAICKKIGSQITADYENKKPVLVGLLKGCIPFMSDLAKHINTHVEFAYMSVSSYHGGISSSGDVKIKLDLDISIKDRDVLIVEDIVDTGSTLSTITKMLKSRDAKSVKVVTLLDKPAGRVVEFYPDYIGKTIPKEFVVGYGLDYDEFYRNLPYVGVLKPSVYTK
ncbi:Hypoxanthine-guanine phosphoribosyltransferase [Alteracholeplasma palmae J233]|uniref:Hypoxanthine phosphoribosyltransferase n=1 Tax=Alteracholeplasma palmae (strain ATCC 49389 / J233) TaxID=1318466 RepID=U4KM03_ALTPJ|nr:hypoxanthine phosphoribosyltransferase [Alteracholeplasma palmae]CCV64973.1 Hypoxanthine-guanine phosphoribosyltransferase [Alteracholeplasma palmae J233]